MPLIFAHHILFNTSIYISFSVAHASNYKKKRQRACIKLQIRQREFPYKENPAEVNPSLWSIIQIATNALSLSDIKSIHYICMLLYICVCIHNIYILVSLKYIYIHRYIIFMYIYLYSGDANLYTVVCKLVRTVKK